MSGNFDKLKNLIPYESTAHVAQHDDAYAKQLMQVPLVQRLLNQHDASQDQLADNIQYLSTIIQPREPMPMGKMLVGNTIYSTSPTVQFGAFTRGKSGRGARGERGYRSRSGRYEKRKIELQDVEDTAEEFDQTFIEDMDAGAIPQYAQQLSYEHDESVSQAILDEIMKGANAAAADNSTTEFTDSSGNVHKRGPFMVDYGNEDFTAEGVFMKRLIQTKGKCKKNHFVPDCALLHVDMETKILQAKDFHNYEVFREFADYKTGMIRNILGMDFIVTDQDLTKSTQGDANDTDIVLFQKPQFLWMYMRRDKMMTAYDRRENLGTGLAFSSRWGFAFGDVTRCCVLTT